MKKYLIGLFLLWISIQAKGQEHPVTEQQVENITEADETETEDDTYLQWLQYYQRHPLNLNTATAEDLYHFPFLHPLQIANLLRHRSLFGRLLSIYELQAIPGWDEATIKRLLPYVYVGNAFSLQESMQVRMRDGERSWLTRWSMTLEKSEGYLRKGDTTRSFYPGSRERVLMRYKYQYKNLLQYGITAEKDPGEQWFKGAQRNGFDFYSAHFFVRNLTPFVKAVALGDYTVNLGQGLIQWQSLAFRKSVEIVNIKRQAPVIRPYNAAGEFFFNRGAAITLGKGSWELTAFASLRNMTANLVTDTSANNDDYVSSLINSGLHRTIAEQRDKNAIQLALGGGNIAYKGNRLHLGMNAVHYQLSKPLRRDNRPYLQFAFAGTQMTNISFDYSYTWRNLHWFGEIARHNQNAWAGITGLLIAVNPKVDLSMLYRNMDKRYHTLFGNAFTEGTFPTNERGFFSGISIKPVAALRFDIYADFYHFPWLRFRINAPSTGYDYLAQLTYKPNKQVEVYTRYRMESRALNNNENGTLVTEAVLPVVRRNWRTQWQYKVNNHLTLRQRMDVMWYDKGGPRESNGFLAFFDVFYKPMLSKIAANLRLQYFETDNFDSRIYAYENDVRYSFSIPAFFDEGYRWYVNLNYDVRRNITCWLRFAQLIYRNRNTVGSGLDEIPANRRSDVRVQLLWTF